MKTPTTAGARAAVDITGAFADLMAFRSCAVRVDPARGRHVVATARIARGDVVLEDDTLVFALEAAFQRTRCALCACPPPRDVDGSLCPACAARARGDGALGAWAEALERLGCASGSVALAAAVLASERVDVAALQSHAGSFDDRVAGAFSVVARGLKGVTGTDEAANLAVARAIATNAHGLVDHGAGSSPPLDGDDALYGVQVGSLLSVPLAAFNHSCAPTAYLSVDLASGEAPVARARATEDLDVGDEVTLAYAPLEAKPAALRRAALRDAYFFECGCRLCANSKDLDALLRKPGDDERDEDEIKILDTAYAYLNLSDVDAAAAAADRADKRWAELAETHGFRIHLSILRLVIAARRGDAIQEAAALEATLAAHPDLPRVAADGVALARVAALAGRHDDAAAAADALLGKGHDALGSDVDPGMLADALGVVDDDFPDRDDAAAAKKPRVE